MVDLQPVQQCHTNDGWVPIRIPSSSHPGHEYTVWVVPWHDPEDYICECKGFFYNGFCYHQGIAADRLCAWKEIEHLDEDDPLHQSPEQKAAKRCPSCGEPTVWTMEDFDGLG